MKLLKSKHRATPTNEHLAELIRIALPTHCPNVWSLANQTNT